MQAQVEDSVDQLTFFNKVLEVFDRTALQTQDGLA